MFTLHNGDCLEYMKTLQPASVDFVYADPPYGVGKADWDNKYFTGWEMLAVKISKHGVVANTGTKSISVAINAFGETYKDLFYAWNKNGMTRSSLGFMNVLVAVVAGEKIRQGQNFAQFSISDLTNKNHPSPKPIEYMRCVIRRFTEPGEIVFDPFMGSGSTGVACMELGRHFIGCELSPEYFAVAEKRIKQASLQQHLFTPSNTACSGRVDSSGSPELFPAEVSSPAKVTRQSTRR
jgi:DNA modification methylase